MTVMLGEGESSLSTAAAASLIRGGPCSGSRITPRRRVNSTGEMLRTEGGEGEREGGREGEREGGKERGREGGRGEGGRKKEQG